MVQEQIVDYISAQFKLGVSRDAVKMSLVGAGWAAADVEDTLKKVELGAAAQPAAAVAPVTVVVAKPAVTVSSPVSQQPQTIKVSDLVSSAPPTTLPASKPAAARSSAAEPTLVASHASSKTKPQDSFVDPSYSTPKKHGSKWMLITVIVVALIAIAAGGFAAFLYTQNNTLNSQLTALNGQSSGVTSQLSALQAQMSASTTALTAQVAAVSTQLQELRTELSFYAPATSTATSTPTSSATISGTVSGGGKIPYMITAMYGARIYVANSKATSVIMTLTPLLGTITYPAPASTTVATSTVNASTTPAPAPTPIVTPPTAAQFSGVYVPGADTITITGVNGSPLL